MWYSAKNQDNGQCVDFKKQHKKSIICAKRNYFKNIILNTENK